MRYALLRFLSHFLALIVVATPTAWLFWTWRHEERKVLESLSFERFKQTLQAPESVMYAIWIFLALAITHALVTFLGEFLFRIFYRRTDIHHG